MSTQEEREKIRISNLHFMKRGPQPIELPLRDIIRHVLVWEFDSRNKIIYPINITCLWLHKYTDRAVSRYFQPD
jgi:hypothetical protein